jgi:hypothetical protein
MTLRRGAVWSAVALAGVALALPAAPARAWSDGPCPTAQGVTVVVDFQQGTDAHGATPGPIVRCATDAPSSGFDALSKAGIDIERVTANPAFLCKIQGVPGAASCGGIPRGSYWSYWVAPRGGAWCYSQVGAAGRTPKAGTVEGWSYAPGSKEGTTPPRPAVPGKVSGSPGSIDDGSCPSPPTTAPTAPPTTAPRAPDTTTPTGPAAPGGQAPPPRGSAGTTPSGSPADGSAPDGAATDGAATASPPDDGTSTSATGGPSTTARALGDEQAAGQVRIRDDDGGGSPVGAIAAGAGVLALGAAAAVAARRRRTAPEPGQDPEPGLEP